MKNPAILNFWGWNPTGDFGPYTCYTAKNKKPVIFIKAPPTTPATLRQTFNHNCMSDIAHTWSSMPQSSKDKWELASKRAHLRMTGYNLFQWFHRHNNRNVIQTIERQAGIQLL